MTLDDLKNDLNIKQQCAQLRVDLWSCPQFLFILMGFIIIVFVLLAYAIAQNYTDPEISALIVLALSAVLFWIGHIIVRSFERVARAAEAKSEFIGIMSHQLRSPLTNIKWETDVLLHDGTLQLQDVQKTLFNIEMQNERMIGVVNSLLEANRIDDGTIVLHPSNFKLSTTTQALIDRFAARSKAENISLSLQVGEDEAAVRADEERVRRVMENLIDNALRFSNSGSEIVIEIKKNNDNIVWRVADAGAGIAAEDQKYIFQKYYRASSVGRREIPGSGLGLFVAKKFIEMNGGKLWF